MNKKTINLNGEWQLKGLSQNSQEKIEINALVPGQVHVDLLRERKIKDPFWRDQAELCQWVEDWNWEYSREFDVPEDYPLEWCELELKGLDTYAEISVNDVIIGNTYNMFIPHTFNVSKYLKTGKNNIKISFTPYKKMVEGKPMNYPAAFAMADRLHVRRIQCTFYWDWVNRFVTTGIWQPVILYSYRKACIRDLFLYTKAIDITSASINIEIEAGICIEENIWADIKILDSENTSVWCSKLRIGDGINHLQADIENAKLWWPNGYGEQPLYQCIVTISLDDGTILDESIKRFGIRTVKIERLKDKLGSLEYERTMLIRSLREGKEKNGDEPGESFTLIVNGERIFCKGGNWVPADPFPSRISNDWYDWLIWLAKEGNVNLLRCWGGGIYEPEGFFEACDKHGIMVSQDFQMACAKYPEDDVDFIKKMEEEIPKAIKLLRGYTSLIWWTGDNENAMSFDFDDINQWGRIIGEQIIRPNLKMLDPSRPFCQSSPFGGRNNLSLTIGDSHYSSWSDMDIHLSDMKDYMEKVKLLVGRFMSESTSMGSPSLDKLLRFMTMKDIEDTSSYMFSYHTKDNPHKPEGSPSLFNLQEIMAEKLLGKWNNAIERVQKLSYVQYEWIRVSMEAARRRKWYCSGLQYWMYNDCWPATGWSIVDYYGYPKAGWYAFKRASKPVIVSIEDEGAFFLIYVSNDSFQPLEGKMRIYVQPWQGMPKWEIKEDFSVAANKTEVVYNIPKVKLSNYLNKESILICDISCEFGEDRAFLYDGMPYEITLPEVTLDVTIHGDESHGKVYVTASSYSRVVTLSGDVYFEDNYFDLLPGEVREVKWTSREGGIDSIKVSCWNERFKTF